MAPYQVLLLDRHNYTFAIEQIEGEDDAAAIVAARKIRMPTFGARFEIWQGERFVCDGSHRDGGKALRQDRLLSHASQA